MSDEDKRVVDLEVRLAFFEDQFDQLSDVVRELHDQVSALASQLGALRAELAKRAAVTGDEPPPHY